MAGQKRSSYSVGGSSRDSGLTTSRQGPRGAGHAGNAALQDSLRARQDSQDVVSDYSGQLSSFGDLLGADLGGFGVGIGGLTEDLDAAGVCDGSSIQLHPAVASSGADLRSLLAHESVHAAQSQRSGRPASVGALEAEADAGATALMAGQPFEVQHTAPAGLGLQESLSTWLKKQFPSLTTDPEEVAKNITPSDAGSAVKEEDGQTFHADTYLGTNEPVRAEDHEFADAKTWRPVGGSVEEKDGVKTTRMDDSANKQGREVRSVKERVFTDGKLTETRDEDAQLDVAATARDTRRALEAAKAPHQSQREQLKASGERLSSDIQREEETIEQEGALIHRLTSSVAADVDAEKDPEIAPKLADARRRLAQARNRKQALVEERRAAALKMQETDQKITALSEEQALLSVDPTQVEAVAKRNGLKVEKRMKGTVSTDSDSGWKDKDGELFAKERVNMNTKTSTAGDFTHVKTKGHTDTVSVKDLKATRERDRGSSKTTVKRADFAGEDVASHKKTSTSSISLKGGPAVGHVRKDEEKRLDGSEDSKSNGGSLQMTGGKLVATGTTGSRSKDANGKVVERDASVSFDGDGAKASASRSDGIEKDHFEAKVTTSANGNFTVTAVPVKGPPPGVKLTTTISGGAALKGATKVKKNGGAEREGAWKDGAGKASAGGHIGGGVSATYTHTRMLSVAEAQSYLNSVDSIDKGGQASGSAPELTTWAKMKAIGDNGGAEKLAAVMGGSDSARSMRDGDAVSMELSGHIEGGVDSSLSGSGVNLGAGLSGKASRTRKVTVARGKDNVVKVTVNFSSASESTLSGSGGAGSASSTVSKTDGSSKGRGVSFTLNTEDPSYDSKYSRILGTMTESGLQGLQKELAKDVTGRSFAKGKKSAIAGTGDVGIGGIGIGQSNETNEEVQLEGKDASGEFTGKGGQNASLNVGGVKVLGSDDEASVSAKVSKDGNVSVDIKQAHTENGLGVPDGMALPDDLESLGEQALLLTQLGEKVQKAETSLRGYRLSGQALTSLVGRAGDHGNWVQCAALHPKSIGSWMTLRGALLSPRSDPEWAKVDPEQAARLARARALAEFAGATGTDGAQVIENALRHWGEGTFGGEAGVALGLGYEWPADIAKHKPTFDATTDGVKELPGKFDGWLAADDGLKEEIGAVQGLTDQLNTVRRAIVGCSAFEEPQMRSELLRQLSADRTTLKSHHANFMQRYQAKTGGKPIDVDAFMSGDAERRVGELKEIVGCLKADEKRLLDRAGSELDSIFIVDTIAVNGWLDEVSRSWDEWEQAVKELRATRIATGMGPDPALGKLMPDTARVIRYRKKLSGFDKLSKEEEDGLPEDSQQGLERDGYAAREHWSRKLASGK